MSQSLPEALFEMDMRPFFRAPTISLAKFSAVR